VDARVRAVVSPHGICDKQSSTGTGVSLRGGGQHLKLCAAALYKMSRLTWNLLQQNAAAAARIKLLTTRNSCCMHFGGFEVPWDTVAVETDT
jgi:hypothetical protein